MQDDPQQTVELSKRSLPDPRDYTEYFQILSHSVTHENRLQVQHDESKEQNIEYPYIVNAFARIQEDKIVKTTSVFFQDRVVKIVDMFATKRAERSQDGKDLEVVCQEPTKAFSKKNLLIRRSKVSNDGEDAKGRDTKNVVKNIFRLYQTWAEVEKNTDLELNTAISSILRMNKKYNNALILKIAKHQQLRDEFIIFCETQGQGYIESSKIGDKLSHSKAMKRYCKICQQEKLVIAEEHQESGDDGESMPHDDLRPRKSNQQTKHQKLSANY